MDTRGTELVGVTVQLGDLVAALYDTLLEEFGDEELAAEATAAWLEEHLADDDRAELAAA